MSFFIYLYFMLSSLIFTEIHPIMLGNTKVQIIKSVKSKGRAKNFVHVHENEVTALAAARLYIIREGGTLITLKHSGKRNIIFCLKGRRYEFDPNRIFTDEGIRRTLKQFGSYSPDAHREVKKLAKQILVLLPPGKIVAVHNNHHYSIKEYLPKHPLAADIGALNFSSKENHRNFYFVTKRGDFNRLKKMQYNVALQANKAQNDGSLSYYLADKSYINTEAAYGKLKLQFKMLRAA